MKISKELKVGLLTLAAIAIAVFGVSFLRGNNLFNPKNIYYARYESSDGLNSSAAVLLHGVPVGKVESVEVSSWGTKPVLVRVHISRDVAVPSNSVLKIVATDLLGGKAMELVQGTSPRMAMTRDTLAGDMAPGMLSSLGDQVTPVTKRVESLVGTIDSVIGNVSSIFNEQTKVDIMATVHSLRKSMEEVAIFTEHMNGPINDRINSIFGTVDKLTKDLSANAPSIRRAVANFENISDTIRAMNLKRTLERVDLALNSVNNIIDKVNKGEGSLGLLVNDKKVYENLEASSKDLDKLIVDIRQNPSRYLSFSVISFNKSKKEPKKVKLKETDESLKIKEKN